MSALIPPRIARGQTLGICAPAGPVNRARFDRGLELLGDAFRLRITDSVLAPRDPGVPAYLAASDAVRAAEFNALLADPDVRAILLARGGYGIMRILPLLDPDLLRADPKPIIGFSDATALMGWAYAAGVRGVHGPMVGQLGDLPPAHVAGLIDIVSVPRARGVLPWTLAVHGSGVIEGALVAANLTLASVLVGTPWALPLAGAIALLEEINEKPYELDRYLTQLSLTGAIRETRAVILGDLTGCDPQDLALATVLERFGSAKIPVAVGAPVGHGLQNEAVPFGAACALDFDRGVLEIFDAAVA